MFKQLAKVCAVLSLATQLAACGGGGGGGGGGSKVQDAAVGGLWVGLTSISGQGDFQLIGIVAENGRAYFLQEDGVMYWGTVTSSGNQITSTLDGAGVYGLPLWDGSDRGTGSASGTIQARSSIAANAIFTTAFGGRTTSSISLTFDPLYNDDSSLALIAGNYVDAIGRYSGVLNIAGNGDLFLQDPGTGCVVNGRVSIIDASYNAYDAQFSYSGCTGPDAVLNGATFRGLAAYDRDFQQVVVLAEGTVGGAPYPNVFVFDPA